MSLIERRSLTVLVLTIALPTLVLLLTMLAYESGVKAPMQTRPDASEAKHTFPQQTISQTQIPGLAQTQVPGPGQDLEKPGQQFAADVDDPLEKQAERERLAMVQEQLAGRDISDERVLKAMQRLPRHLFVPQHLRKLAYADAPLPIGHGQTISQPYIVALMTQLGQPLETARVLDVGTGSGYQAAVLAELVRQVDSIEIVCPLADEARQRLKSLGYNNIEVRCGDGHLGWPEHAPFDVIIVAAAPDSVPQPLVDQLAVGGRLVIPVGTSYQELMVIEKRLDGGVKRWSVAPVRFVPMTGVRKSEDR